MTRFGETVQTLTQAQILSMFEGLYFVGDGWYKHRDVFLLVEKVFGPPTLFEVTTFQVDPRPTFKRLASMPDRTGGP